MDKLHDDVVYWMSIGPSWDILVVKVPLPEFPKHPANPIPIPNQQKKRTESGGCKAAEAWEGSRTWPWVLIDPTRMFRWKLVNGL